jgi:hypothetical protein
LCYFCAVKEMADEQGPASNSNSDLLEGNDGNVSKKSRSCRGCLYYSSIMRENVRNPVCIGLSRSTEPEAYRVPGDLEREITKNGHALPDFKYACIGYSVYKEITSSPPSPHPEDQVDLPYCVGLEFLADRKPTQQGIPGVSGFPANPASVSHERPPHRDDEGPKVMPRPPSSIGGGGGLSGDEFATRFFRNAGLVASAVVHNVGRVANSVRTTIDDIFASDQGRPKS